MRSIIFAGKIVMVFHIVTLEIQANEYVISLSNGLVLKETFESEEEKVAIAKRLAFDGE